MTAEVAVMNASAVALAADSYATVNATDQEKRAKTHEVNKLFTLSKYEPLGIMIYGAAAVCGVPWETIIKVYRSQLQSESFPTVESYSANFFKFAGAQVPKPLQVSWLRETLTSFYSHVAQTADEAVKARIESSSDGLTPAQISRLNGSLIKKQHDVWEARSLRPGLSRTFEKKVMANHSKIISEAIRASFEERPLSAAAKATLTKLGSLVICRDVSLPSQTGVVVAGFGTSELFPAVHTTHVFGVIDGRLLVC